MMLPDGQIVQQILCQVGEVLSAAVRTTVLLHRPTLARLLGTMWLHRAHRPYAHTGVRATVIHRSHKHVAALPLNVAACP